MQTQDEQRGRTTREINRLGFSKFDADILSDISERYYKFNYLTDKQIMLIRKKILKYRKQLARLHNSGSTIAPDKEIMKFGKEKWPSGRFSLRYNKSTKKATIEKGDPKKKARTKEVILKYNPSVGLVTVEGDTFPVKETLKKFGLGFTKALFSWPGGPDKNYWSKFVTDLASAQRLASQLKTALEGKAELKTVIMKREATPRKDAANEVSLIYRNGKITLDGNTEGIESFLADEGFVKTRDNKWMYTEKAFTLFKAKEKIKEFKIALKANPIGRKLLVRQDVPK
jgi:hypothetical protein